MRTLAWGAGESQAATKQPTNQACIPHSGARRPRPRLTTYATHIAGTTLVGPVPAPPQIVPATRARATPTAAARRRHRSALMAEASAF